MLNLDSVFSLERIILFLINRSLSMHLCSLFLPDYNCLHSSGQRRLFHHFSISCSLRHQFCSQCREEDVDVHGTCALDE